MVPAEPDPGRALGSGGQFGVAFVEELPVHDFGQGTDVFVPAVLVLEVIGVFPEIDSEEDLAALKEGRVLVGGGFEFEGTILVDADPEPAAAEDGEGGLDEVLAGFLGIGGVEGLEDGFAQGVAGAGSIIATEGFPEEGMVDVATGIVADGGADPFGDLVEVGEEFLGRILVEIGVVGDGLVQVVDVGGMMFAVMDLHGLGIDVGFQGIEAIAQGRQFVGAGGGGLGEDVAGGNGCGGNEGGTEGLTARQEKVHSADDETNETRWDVAAMGLGSKARVGKDWSGDVRSPERWSREPVPHRSPCADEFVLAPLIVLVLGSKTSPRSRPTQW